MTPYLIDLAPVTQAEFAAYLAKEKALPTDRYHYLKNWDWSGETPKPGAGNGSLPVSTTIIGDILAAFLPTSFSKGCVIVRQVTYVGYSEAKAYCTSLAQSNDSYHGEAESVHGGRHPRGPGRAP